MSGHPGTLMPPWPKGVSGNPGGRVRLARAPSTALAELNDTSGNSIPEIVENFKAARKQAGGLVAADHKAIAAFKRDLAEAAYGVAAFDSTTDRLEGKVAQRQDTTLRIELVPYRFVGAPEIEGAHSPGLLEAEVVEEETKP